MIAPCCLAADKAVPASQAATAPVAGNLLGPTADVKSWKFELTEDGGGAIKSEDGAIAFVVTKVDGTDWHVQAFQTGLDLKAGMEYVLTFRIRASAKRTVQIYAGVNEDDYHPVGLDEVIELTTEWQDLKFTFKADDVAPKNNRLGFLVGQDPGTVWVKDLVLRAKTP